MPNRIAYFINQYPKVSHSFIRREILGLEALGFEVLRYALRCEPDQLVDEQDKEEYSKTHYVLKEGVVGVGKETLKTLLASPKMFFSTLWETILVGWRSERGLLRHFFYFAEACQLLSWLREEKVEHIHAHFGTNSTTVVMLAKLLGGPGYSFTVHGPDEFDKPEFLAIRKKIHYSEFVSAITSYTRSQLYRWSDYRDWDKIKIVHCGLGEDFIKASPALLVATPRFVCVGRLCGQKGQLLLLEAVARLAGKGIDFELVLAGDGEMRGEIEAGIRQWGLEKHVTITGWISSEQVGEHIKAAKALVLPSFAEGLPVVIMEAMALARPVITTYIAGIPELVVDKENGWLVPAGDIDALVGAMEIVLGSSDEDLLEMGLKGQQAVRREHDISVETAKLAEYIKVAINGSIDA